MKAISEYFRDLAERDRFFGAEPPQPDAEYLHRIAEQTIKSRVEAEVSDNSLILRQEQDTAKAAPAVAAPVAAPAPTPEPAPAPSLAAVSEPETAAFVQPVIADRAGFGEGDTIAEKLQRIRAVVSRENAAPVEDTSFYNEDEHADDFTTTEPVEPPASFVADDTFEDEADADTADANILGSIMADMKDDAAEETPVDEPVADTADAEADAVADHTEAEAEAEVEAVAADVEEDAPVAEVETDVKAVLDDTAPEVEAEGEAVAEDAIDDAAAKQANASETEAADTADADAEATAEPEAAEAAADEVAANEVAADEDSAEPADLAAPVVKPRRRIIVQKISRADVEAAQAGGETDAQEEPSAELDAEAEAALMAELADVEAEMELDDGDAPSTADTADAEMEARALASAQAAQAKADAEADARKQADADAAAAQAAAAKAEAEAKAAEEADALAKVMAEAAEVEAETKSEAEEVAEDAAATGDEAEAQTDAPETEENRAARLARRSLMVEDEDEALNRLMDATSTRLSDDDEGAVRRASIAHLKAAVAATKADDSIAKAAADEEERELDQYRDDLARVVRPGRARPRADGAATSRPAPLVLVSEQRIDTPAPSQADAAIDVRPRRITSGNLALAEELEEEVDENLFEDANVESFSTYAERHDALELPDLLEAAAAHYAFVEGAEEFTRPMLMRKIASLTTGEAPSREAGLRSFGSLLREGRVVKSGNGKFVLSGKSRFTPEAREAGE